jgi:hypothetical protein
MEAKEKIKYFNQRFLTLMKRIPQSSKPAEDVSIEFYTSYLIISMVMFIKNSEKSTLSITFKEAFKVEKVGLSLQGNLGAESSKSKANIKNKMIVMNPSEYKKDFDSTYM